MGVVDADRDRAAEELVVLSLMAVSADEVQSAHVDIDVLFGVEQAAVQVAVLDGVAAAAGEMAGAAVLAGRGAHALGGGQQVDLGDRDARVALGVGRWVGVADQAVDVAFIGEIEVGVLPAVAGVAARAARPVGLDGGAGGVA